MKPYTNKNRSTAMQSGLEAATLAVENYGTQRHGAPLSHREACWQAAYDKALDLGATEDEAINAGDGAIASV